MLPPRINDRRELADFVRNRRERVSPAAAGIAGSPRRRTPGLRREELAQLAGIGITWLTWFEQGRDIQVSVNFLENLSRALNLDDAERRHLFLLAQHRLPPRKAAPAAGVSSSVLRILNSYPYPIYVKNERWNVVAWNRPAETLFGDYNEVPLGQRNVVWLVMTHPYYRRFMVNWAIDAKNVVARFRGDAGRLGSRSSISGLVKKLEAASPEFRIWWQLHDLIGSSNGTKWFWHASVGEMEFEHTRFQLDEASPDTLCMVMYAPTPGDSDERARHLFGTSLARGDGDSVNTRITTDLVRSTA